MADQMREARRKRILENSEKRLQRILGVNSNVEGNFHLMSKQNVLEINLYFLLPQNHLHLTPSQCHQLQKQKSIQSYKVYQTTLLVKKLLFQGND